MLDSKSKLVLKILAKECNDGSYKIIEGADVISSLPKHYRTDSDGLKHILTHLERQDMISIKYDDDDVYCISVLPFGFEALESEKPKIIKKDIYKEKSLSKWTIFLSFISALLGTTIGIIVAYFILR